MSISLLNQMIILFGLIIVGYIANKAKILDELANMRFSSFLLKIALPSTILNSAFSNQNAERGMILHVMIVSIAIFIVVPILSKIAASVFGLEPTYQLMLNYSNLGFMGFPIVNSIYGEEAVIYAAIFMMVFNVHIFTAGIIVLQGKTQNMAAMLKQLCSPGIISSLLAFVIVLLKIPGPVPVINLVSDIGAVTTPLAMIVIGSQLAQVNVLKSFSNKKMYIMSLIKLVIYPILVYVSLKWIIGPGLITNVSTILFGLPIAGNVSMICSDYGGETALAAEGTCITTLFSLITIPIMLVLIQQV